MLWSGAFLMGVGTVWSFTHGITQFLAPLDFGTEEFAYPGIALVFAALVAHIVTAPPIATVPRLFTNRTLRTLGKYSYGLYLIHVPVRNVARIMIEGRGGLPELWGSQVPAQIVVTIVGIVVSFTLAYASWHLFEKQVLKLKSRFDSRTAPADPPVPNVNPLPAPLGTIAPQEYGPSGHLKTL
jgi:peptidoglycan/LPS O-acetylase OafA/YrhL